MLLVSEGLWQGPDQACLKVASRLLTKHIKTRNLQLETSFYIYQKLFLMGVICRIKIRKCYPFKIRIRHRKGSCLHEQKKYIII